MRMTEMSRNLDSICVIHEPIQSSQAYQLDIEISIHTHTHEIDEIYKKYRA